MIFCVMVSLVLNLMNIVPSTLFWSGGNSHLLLRSPYFLDFSSGRHSPNTLMRAVCPENRVFGKGGLIDSRSALYLSGHIKSIPIMEQSLEPALLTNKSNSTACIDNMKVILSTVMICALHNRKSNSYLKGMTYDNGIKKTGLVQASSPHKR
jgi:hypothetical protein